MNSYKLHLWTSVRNTTNPTELTLRDFCDKLKNGYWSRKVDEIRNAKDANTQALLKAKLPCITGSGLFKKRATSGLIEHNGLIVIDIDYIGEQKDTLREKLTKDKYTFVLFESVRANGFAIFIKIDKTKHINSFLELEEYFKKNYSIDIDKSCKNVDRLRFVSYDPNVFINQNSLVWQNNKKIKNIDYLEKAIQIIHRICNEAIKGTRYHTLYRAGYFAGGVVKGLGLSESILKAELVSIASNLYAGESSRLGDAVRNIDNGLKDGEKKPIDLGFDKGKYQLINKDNFEHQSAEALKNSEAIKIFYRECFEWLREGIKDYSERINSSISGLDRKTAESIAKKIYAQNQEQFGINHKTMTERILFFLNQKYILDYNEITHFTQKFYKETGEELSGEDLEIDLKLNKLKISYAELERLLRSKHVNRYNPIKQYFESLEHWDGVDTCQELCNFITLEDMNQIELFSTMLKKMLVRCIKCGLGEEVNRFVFTLISEGRSIGKSMLIQKFNPFDDNDYYTQSKIDDGKDTQIALGENFIWNLDELKGVKQLSNESFKSIISTAVVKERRPYAKNVEKIIRIANFFASTNQKNFLVDEEDTRWICFEIQDIDYKGYAKHINFKKLWSQIYYLYKTGYDSDLTFEEKEAIIEINRNYAIESNELNLLHKFIKIDNKLDASECLTGTEIITELGKNININALRLDVHKLGKALKQIGVNNTKITKGTSKVTVYFCRVETESIVYNNVTFNRN